MQEQRSVKNWIMSVGFVLALVPPLVALMYILRYGFTFPFIDQWLNGAVIANKVHDGSFVVSDVLLSANLHRTVFANIVTAILARFTSWNIFLETIVSWVNVCLIFILCYMTVRGVDRDLANWLVLPLSLVVFNIAQRTNLAWGYTGNNWFWVNLFWMAAVYIIVRFAPGWKPLVVVLVLTLCAVMSVSIGLLLLVIIPQLLWLSGYKKNWYYVIWLGWGVFCYTVYRYVGQTEVVTGSESIFAGALEHPVFYLTFVIANNASLFLLDSPTAPVWLFPVISGAGVTILLVNFFYMWRPGRHTKLLVLTFILVEFGVAHAALAGLGRAAYLWAGAQSRFVSTSIFYWIAFLVLGATVIKEVVTQRERTQRQSVWMWVNAGAIGAVMAGVIVSNIAYYAPPTISGITVDRRDTQQCYWSYQIAHSETCIHTIEDVRFAHISAREIETLFDARLGEFARYDGILPIVAQMPSLFTLDDGLIISAEEPHQQVQTILYTDRTTGKPASLSPDQFRRVMHSPDGGHPDLQQNTIIPTAENIQQLRDFVQFRERVWYFRADLETDFDELIRDELEQHYDSIALEGTHWRTTVYEHLTLYVRRSAPLFVFGDEISLESWKLDSDYTLQPCQFVEFDALFYAIGQAKENYSLALVLVDETGVDVARVDEPPGDYMMSLWQPDSFTFTENAVQLPCDIDPGSYSLLIGMYEPGTGNALTVTDSGGNVQGDLLYMTTITVTSGE